MESTFVPTIEREYGRNALPNLFDTKAKDPSSRPYAYVMKTPNPEDGFDTVTYSIMANAINRASWWLVNEVRLAEGEVFAYLGPSDLRYVFLFVAAAKTGRKIMLPSLRNTVSAQMALFKNTNTRIILYADELQKNLQSLFAAAPDINTTEVPGYKSFIDETSVPHYHARELSDDKFHDPICILHTSGSSGNPKPVGQSPAFWLRCFSFLDVPDDGDIHSIVHIGKGYNLLQLLPQFHMAGLCFMMLITVLDSTAVMNHPAVAITGEHVVKILNQGIVTAFNATDSILTDLSSTKEGLEALSKLECIGYGGGSLSPKTGAILALHVKNLCSAMGMTENALFHGVALKGASHWDCLRFNSGVGYRFEETSPGIYELIISLRPEYARFHSVALLFPDLQEFATKDLYTRVPEIENGYRYQGRRDDLIVLSNGEKISPTLLEAIVATHPLVKSALFASEHRFLPSLLIELVDGHAVNNEEESRVMIERLWDIISEANFQAPRFSRVPKSLIYILRPTESFERSPKGTVQRQVTVRTLASQIDTLYAAAAETDILTDGLELADLSEFDSTKHLANKLYRQVLGFDSDKVLGDGEDVFELGMDSLQAAVAVLKLKAVFRVKDLKTLSDKISPHFFYSSPSSSKLARSIQNLIKNGVDDDHTDRRVYLQRLIDKYSAGLEVRLMQKRAPRASLTVVLTGSTGSLGSYLLQSLIDSPRVSRIICLNRSKDAQKRQTAGNKSRGLSTPWESEDNAEKAVEFLTADLSSPDLGLGEAIYSQLQAEVDAIIHNAWKVDFNHTVESFEKTHIAGTRHLIDLSRKCEYQAPIFFISTISTTMNCIQKPVPESSTHDLNSPAFIGYAESKYVAERLIEAHSSSAGFISSVMRVGQIAGPVLSTAGVWGLREWFPSLLASSKYLGVLPESLRSMGDSISWIPVDILARIIIQLLLLLGAMYDDENDDGTKKLAVYNIVNPRTVPWSALLETIQIGLGGQDKIRIVPLDSWIEALERSAQETHGLVIESNPATKLLDFWRNVADQSKDIINCAKKDEDDSVQREFEVVNLQSHSSEARNLQAVSPEWMKVWMGQWGF